MNDRRWMRVIGNTILAVGALLLGWFGWAWRPVIPTMSAATYARANGGCGQQESAVSPM